MGDFSAKNTFTIYALIDPNTQEVRYVGQTAHNPWNRYSHHVLNPVGSTKGWILGLRATRQVPDLKILEEDLPLELSYIRERYWIDYWRNQGVALLNYYPKLDSPQKPKLIQERSVMPRKAYRCRQCRHLWVPKHGKYPDRCANPDCRSMRWNQPKEEKLPRGRPRRKPDA
jgi:hypothetical protein